MRKNIISVLFCIVLFAIGFLLGNTVFHKKSEPIVIEKIDTLIVRDTFTIDKPKIVERRVVEKVPYVVRDTLHKTDTLWLEREAVVYKDSLVRVVASGISPSIDSVTHYVSTKIITKEIPYEVARRPRWVIGVTAGYGVAKDGLSPYVGVGVTYPLLSFGKK